MASGKEEPKTLETRAFKTAMLPKLLSNDTAAALPLRASELLGPWPFGLVEEVW